ncbi:MULTISPECIES: cytochrome C [Ramlibacter]|uniref:Cytochrome C n=1 Tax=Ramlibacter aquaticus TaxID=2780094 RepID=A0ABR9SGE3_9BURK|nr:MULTISPECIES: cytochrome C [Ramlibacter]MBE7941425.1 cytochrome C [Ramlibacter aquaticus]
MKTLSIGILLASACIAGWAQAPAGRGEIERGRYLVTIGGCNDCHTPGWGPTGGKVPEQEWLVGDKVGFSGPWGTTYPANLRLLMQGMTQAQWVQSASTRQLRPPMPWFNLHAMTPEDLAAIYAFVHALGPRGEAAPAYLPPGQKPAGPAILFPAPPAAQ